jgi:NADH-quinone oxidoreductase subunit H
MMLYFLQEIGKVLVILVPLLLSVAYLTLAERKIMGAIQRRRGPNVIGLFGLLQPLADGLKLLLKETIIPVTANTFLFLLAPLLTFLLALLGWGVLPYGEGLVYSDINVGLLYLLAVSSLGVYGVLIAGWASNSKYAFLGALRSAAQMVSYEVSLGLIIITVILCGGSLNLSSLVLSQEEIWYLFPLSPIFVTFYISALAETNRHPFDLPEAESELVSGYNVEYAAMSFALFFLGEYANILLMSAMTALLFLGGWLSPFPFFPFTLLPGAFYFGLKIIIFAAGFAWARAAFPRYRYDQLMRLGWKIFLPLSLGWLFFTAGILLAFNWLPF